MIVCKELDFDGIVNSIACVNYMKKNDILYAKTLISTCWNCVSGYMYYEVVNGCNWNYFRLRYSNESELRDHEKTIKWIFRHKLCVNVLLKSFWKKLRE